MNKLLSALLAVLALSSAAQAGTLADLSVINRNTGRALPVYYHLGRYYIAGTPGEKYAVAVRNKTAQRILTVVSVDGVNAVSGETAAPEQTGYVLDPWLRYEITGWRKSLDEVAAFVFTALPDSYAARTGRPQNVGVIGVAVFREYQLPRPPVSLPEPRPYAYNEPGSTRQKTESTADRARGAGAPSAAPAEIHGLARMQQPEEKLGTGHGEREASQVSNTEFQRASERPYEVVTIYYDSQANLIARGIIPRPSRTLPDPFPAGGQFVPDPKS